jgi:hypothetical protein
MKKLFIAFLISLTYTSARACDICGLGTSNYNPFLFPHLSKNYLSINYLHRLYHIHSDGGLNKEYFNTVLISGQYSINEKLQLVAMLPYQLNRQENFDGTKNIKGLGDVTLMGNYRLWNHQGRSKTQTVLVGAGVKLPTGNYEASKTETIEDQNFQLGTGSIDYMLNASYRLSYRKWIFSAVGSYKYNTENKENYRYGDVLTTGATAVYRKELRNFSIAPYVQLMNETQMKDANDHLLQEHSGGSALYTGGGIDLNTRKIAVGVNYQFAAKQNLFQGEINAKPRLSVHLSFVL